MRLVAAMLALPLALAGCGGDTSGERRNPDRRELAIATPAEALAKRAELVRYVWGDDRLPRGLPTMVERGVRNPRLEGLPNLGRIDRIVQEMGAGLSSTAYLIHPDRRENGRLIVVHGGHLEAFDEDRRPLAFFLERGYVVLGISMPLVGENADDRFRGGDGNHELLFTLPVERPQQLFFEPIAASLNLAAGDYRSIAMTGISGGGWTTALYSAMDPRVTRAFPVEGTLPLYDLPSQEWGDYENSDPNLLARLTYLEIYALGGFGAGRREIQVFHPDDNCCFRGDHQRDYAQVVTDRVASLGGSFRVVEDTGNREHRISERTLRLIDREIRRG